MADVDQVIGRQDLHLGLILVYANISMSLSTVFQFG